jgi:hypothetical protein
MGPYDPRPTNYAICKGLWMMYIGIITILTDFVHFGATIYDFIQKQWYDHFCKYVHKLHFFESKFWPFFAKTFLKS